MASDEGRLFDYDIRFETNVMAWPSGEPTDYVIDIEATISYDPEGSSRRADVGHLRAHLIQLGRALDDAEPFEEVFDAHSAALYDVYRALFDRKKRQLRAKVDEAFEVIGLDLLYLESVEIDAGHRGNGLGLVAVSRCIDVWDPQQGLVVCKPYPMQFDSAHEDDDAWRKRVGVDAFVSDKDAASQKLRNYWSRLGFEQVPGAKYWALSTVGRRPAIKDAVAHSSKRARSVKRAASRHRALSLPEKTK